MPDTATLDCPAHVLSVDDDAGPETSPFEEVGGFNGVFHSDLDPSLQKAKPPTRPPCYVFSRPVGCYLVILSNNF